jgi:hypothetical protein
MLQIAVVPKNCDDGAATLPETPIAGASPTRRQPRPGVNRTFYKTGARDRAQAVRTADDVKALRSTAAAV